MARNLAALGTNLDHLVAGEATRFPVPKGSDGSRSLDVFSPRDRLGFRAIITPMIEPLRAVLRAEVVGQRFFPIAKSWTLEAVASAQAEYRQRVIRKYRDAGFRVMVKVDVANYYPEVELDLLSGFLLEIGSPEVAVKALKRFLGPLHRLGVFSGLPVMPEPSAVLGTTFLAPLDYALTGAGATFFRWVDDYTLMGKTSSQVLDIIPFLKSELGLLGLRLAEGKTRGPFEDDAIIEEVTDASKDSLAHEAQYGYGGIRADCHDFFQEKVVEVDAPETPDIRWILGMFLTHRDHYAAEYLAENPLKALHASPMLGKYLSRYGADFKVIDGVLGFLDGQHPTRHEIVTLHLLRATKKFRTLGGAEEELFARLAWNPTLNPHTRSMGWVNIGVHGKRRTRDVEDGALATEPSSVVRRGMLASLRAARVKPAAFLGEVRRRFPDLIDMVDFVKAA